MQLILVWYKMILKQDNKELLEKILSEYVCLCWGFTAQSTQWGHVERGQFT